MSFFRFGCLFAGGAFLMTILLGSLGCGKKSGQSTENFEELSIAICAPNAGPFTLNIDNPFFPLPPGRTLELEGDESGKIEHLTFTVTNETQVVAGVTTRVATETHFENGVKIEVSRNFFAQAPDSTVCYFGEEVDNIQGGVTDHTGTWHAGEAGALPGILMPGTPRVGTKFSNEMAPGVAEDRAAVVGVNETVREPAGEFKGVVRTIDWDPLEGQTSADGEEKFYAPDVGLIEDEVVELLSFTP
jgi:hypothetical protein